MQAAPAAVVDVTTRGEATALLLFLLLDDGRLRCRVGVQDDDDDDDDDDEEEDLDKMTPLQLLVRVDDDEEQ